MYLLIEKYMTKNQNPPPTPKEWRKSPKNPRNNPLLSPKESERSLKEAAIAGGQKKWDVQERSNKINEYRRKLCNGEIETDMDTWIKLFTGHEPNTEIANPRCLSG